MLRKIRLTLLGIPGPDSVCPAEKNQSASLSSSDVTTKYTVPADVHNVLNRSCFDCHSNNTVYSWYDHIHPVSWVLDHHIEEGKISEFTTYSPKKARHKMEEVGAAVTEGWMPLNFYLWIYHEAKLVAKSNSGTGQRKRSIPSRRALKIAITAVL